MAQPSREASPVGPELPRPRLQRTDSRKMKEDELDRKSFGASVESVYYYNEAGLHRCAILLRTSFVLKPREYMKSARIPLIASPPQDGAGGPLDITAWFPNKEERVEFTASAEPRRNETDVKATAVGAARGKLSFPEDDNPCISLSAQRRTVVDSPTELIWKLENLGATCFPSAINLVVVVTGTVGENQQWFPFDLTLDRGLKLEVQAASVISRIQRFVIRPPTGTYCFPVRGPHKPHIAQEAMGNALDPRDRPGNVGLLAAMHPILNPQTRVLPSAISKPTDSNSNATDTNQGPTKV